jgi:hypothetical protein
MRAAFAVSARQAREVRAPKSLGRTECVVDLFDLRTDAGVWIGLGRLAGQGGCFNSDIRAIRERQDILDRARGGGAYTDRCHRQMVNDQLELGMPFRDFYNGGDLIWR